jgi:hypothetical protein
MKCTLPDAEIHESWKDKPFIEIDDHIYISPRIDNSGEKTVCLKCLHNRSQD